MMAGSHKQRKEENCLDLRYQFLRGLIQYEEWQRTRHYLKSAAECTSRAIVSLELSPQPIRSPRHAQQLQSIGGETMKKLKKFAEEDRLPKERPLSGEFVSSAGALLVALKKEEDIVEKTRNEDYMRVSEERLKAGAAKLCEERFSRDGFCQAWWRLEVLIKRGLIKRRFHKKLPVYQLLPEGQEMADRLIVESRNSEHTHNGIQPGDTPWSHGPVSTEHLESGRKSPGLLQSNCYTSPHRLLVPRKSNKDSPDELENDKSRATVTRVPTDSFYRSVQNLTPNENKSNFSKERDKFLYKSTGNDGILAATNVKVEKLGNSQNKVKSVMLPWQHEQTGTDGCHGNDKGNDGLVMVIDSAEWSRDHENLTKLGAMLGEAGIAHTSTNLTTGDYCWKWRHGIERELPCLLVRKRAGDLSRMLKEGKFWSQVQKMVDWKKEFMTFDLHCELFYIIEGEADYKDRCLGVGPGRNPTLTQVKNAVLDLQRHPGIQVLQSTSTEETLAILESINVDLDQRIKTGKFDMMLKMEWEKCQETIINIDDSDEEVLPSSSGRQVSTQRFSVNTSNCPDNSGNIHKSKSQICEGSRIPKSHPLSGEDGDDLDDIYPLDGEMEDPDWLPDIAHEPRSRDRVSETDNSASTDTTGIHHKNLKRKINSVQDEEILTKKQLSLSKPGRIGGKGLQNGFLLDSGISDCVERDDEAPSYSHFGRHSVINEPSGKSHQGENSGDEVEDWWNSRDKEPLVMYHNSYGFTPALQPKILTISLSLSTKFPPHTNEKNHKGVTSCTGYRPVSPGNEEGQSAGGSPGQEKVTQILDMFPALTREVVYRVLTRHSGDLNSCVEELLQTSESLTP